jgi:hypothetical protein
MAKARGVAKGTLTFYIRKHFGSTKSFRLIAFGPRSHSYLTNNNNAILWNHRVVSVTDAGEADVYDISVDDHHNFALDAGVIAHNSLGILQTLKELGYNTKQVSVDRVRKNSPYDVLKLALYENRISYYRYEPLLKEMRNLEKNWKTGKVDHKKDSQKDCSDALAGSIFTLSEDAHTYRSSGADSPSPTRDDESDSWVVDGIPVDSAKPDYQSEAERAIRAREAVEEKGSSDYSKSWKKNFKMPFEVG